MRRAIQALGREIYDVAVIGGGITGAFLALDAVRRGLMVVLVEQGDFGAATSAASSKLLHGGIRYLQQGQLGKVRESALERVFFQNLAPHLSHYVPFVVPTFRGLRRGRWLLGAGMVAYQALCVGQDRFLLDPARRVPGWSSWNRAELMRWFPILEGTGATGAVVYYESHMHSSERMTWAVLSSAAREGATLANYARVTGFIHNGSVVRGIRVRDELSGDEIEVRARVTVNAAGPWLQPLNDRLLAGRAARLTTGFAKGAHIVVPALFGDHALAWATRQASRTVIDRGGRHVFFIPWRGRTLIGTTYTPLRSEEVAAAVSANEVAAFVEELNRALPPLGLRRQDIQYAFAGIYPLQADRIRPQVYQGSGQFQIRDHTRDGIAGLVSVLGAKYTTARLVAEQAMNLIGRRLGNPRPGDTRQRPLWSGDVHPLEAFIQSRRRAWKGRLAPEVVDDLVRLYGRDMDAVAGIAAAEPSLARPLVPERPVIGAQLVYAARNEMVQHLDDVLLRRTDLGSLGYLDRQALASCAALVGKELGWDASRQAQEVARMESNYRWCDELIVT